VNVTFCPAQIVLPRFDAIDTDAVWLTVTVIVIEFDVAGDPVAQVAFDVITQVTTSPFTKLVVV
jgi:hypothetical protein